MGELDFFEPDAREELIDGEIFDIPPPSPKHANTVMYMHNVVPHALWDLTIVSILNPLRLSTYTEVRPDIALLRPRDDYYAARRPSPADALLIIEVADV
jgi:Uma2 family endonuclease